jgi:iron complex transport system substrate-binding protein
MKIISLQPSISIILDHLGSLDSLVACTKYCLDAVPALRARNLAIVHDSWSTKADELIPVEADLLIASIPYRQESLTAILKSGRPVLTLAPHRLVDVYQDIRLIASVVGAADRGEDLVTAMQSAVDGLRARTSGFANKPLVYCEEWGKPLIHSQLWVKEMVEAAGGIFLGEPGTHTQPETIAEADPDIFLAAWCGAGDRVPLEKIVQQRGWEQVRAVQNQRVYCIADELLNTPAPNLIAGLEALKQAIHPDVFGTIAATSGRQIHPFPAPAV